MDKTIFPDVFQELDTKHFARQLKQMADDFNKCIFKCTTLTNEELEK